MDREFEVVRVGGAPYRCFRLITELGDLPPPPPLEKASDYLDEGEDSLQIERDPVSGARATHITIPHIFHSYLVGKGGATRRKIQGETGAVISLPPRESENDDVILKGPTDQALQSAKTQIEILVETAKKSVPFTHFVCVPLALHNPELVKRLTQLHSDILTRHGSASGMDPSILVPPSRLHLTLFMTKLFTKEDVARAAEILTQAEPTLRMNVMQGDPLALHIKGLEYMNDDPSAVDVLYLNVTEEHQARDHINRLAAHLKRAFQDAGLYVEEDPDNYLRGDLKIHATLINTRYRRVEPGQPRGPRVPVDCRQILADLAACDLGTHICPEVHLSQRLIESRPALPPAAPKPAPAAPTCSAGPAAYASRGAPPARPSPPPVPITALPRSVLPQPTDLPKPVIPAAPAPPQNTVAVTPAHQQGTAALTPAPLAVPLPPRQRQQFRAGPFAPRQQNPPAPAAAPAPAAPPAAPAPAPAPAPAAPTVTSPPPPAQQAARTTPPPPPTSSPKPPRGQPNSSPGGNRSGKGPGKPQAAASPASAAAPPQTAGDDMWKLPAGVVAYRKKRE
ncbi:putative activating signal cointegrator 1 complex subunit 1 [Paratrimastix pyriformis]|uniref:Activating signal cointegrator 1 complex subunit 1 n=1 Tax=Paratrimastix pyriformis TaxID=342808 RepID=A0ABQ8UKS3_9EUKA|nr:putative activating signal cointegrator 1 complex subunit 1 [Paratrimastix pyriformis]